MYIFSYLSCLFICPSKWSKFSIQLALEFSMWFSSRLQPWLQQRRNWRGWAPQKRRGRTWRQTSLPLRAGNSFCAQPCPALLPTPGLCLSACTVFSPKRISDLQVPFHQIPPSSSSSWVPSLWLRRQCWPLLWEGSCVSQNLRGHEEDLSSSVIESYQHLKDFLMGSVASWWGQRNGLQVLKDFCSKEIALVGEEGQGGH